MHAQHRRHADGQVHVGAALLRAELQERVDARQVATLLRSDASPSIATAERAVKCDAVRAEI